MNRRAGDKAEELGLEEISFEDVINSRTLSRSWEPQSLATSSGFVSLRLSGDLKHWPGIWAQVNFEIGGRSGAIWLPYDLIASVIGRVYPEVDIRDLDPLVRAAVLEHVERDLAERIERHTNAPFELTGVHIPASPEGARVMVFEATTEEAETPHQIAIQCNPIDRDYLLRWIQTWPIQRRAIENLSIPVCFRAGYATLTAGDLASIVPGAGIILDDTYLTIQKIAAVTAERYVQTCTWQTVTPVLDGMLLQAADMNGRHYTMRGNVTEESFNTQVAPASAKDVPVHLVFELGRIEVPVGELETLDQGYVFDLGKPLTQAVDILSGGRRIGTGELVRIADSIGVRVIRIAT